MPWAMPIIVLVVVEEMAATLLRTVLVLQDMISGKEYDLSAISYQVIQSSGVM